MNKIDNLITRLKKFDANFDNEVIEATKLSEAEIIDYNVEQLDNGINGDGTDIEPPYTAKTIQIKRFKRQPTNRVTLKDTGDFHDSFFVVWNVDKFYLSASDEKTDKLERKYSRYIFGLTDNNLQDVIDLVKPDLIERFKKIILLM